MKDFYLLDKKEMKKEFKKFNKTRIGKMLNFQWIIFLIGSFSFMILMYLEMLIEIIVNTDNEIINLLNSIDLSIIVICMLLSAGIASIFYTTYLKFFKDYYDCMKKGS